jgi:hypothetical protein
LSTRQSVLRHSLEYTWRPVPNHSSLSGGGNVPHHRKRSYGLSVWPIQTRRQWAHYQTNCRSPRFPGSGLQRSSSGHSNSANVRLPLSRQYRADRVFEKTFLWLAVISPKCLTRSSPTRPLYQGSWNMNTIGSIVTNISMIYFL